MIVEVNFIWPALVVSTHTVYSGIPHGDSLEENQSRKHTQILSATHSLWDVIYLQCNRLGKEGRGGVGGGRRGDVIYLQCNRLGKEGRGGVGGGEGAT